ncbi:MAG: LytTR family transcriptional regulator [Sphingomonadales bacterium]|nr:MAG: LytTR family transcriptional regulator [Sphingomonadales bacterium]
MPAVRSVLSGLSVAPGKRGFAKAAHGFAKRAMALPGFPYLWIGCAAAAGLMTITGGFRTGDLPLDKRALFWMVLMGWNAIKWQALFALFVRKQSDWWRVSLLGGVPLNLMLPLEIAGAGRIAGTGVTAPPLEILGRAASISLGIFLVCSLIGWMLWRRAQPRPMPASGLLARARIDPAHLIAIEAEDHYCRVHDRSGASALIHYRFGDAIEEVSGLEGTQVHRGTWVAANAVEGAAREGRRWALLLAGGQRVAVSATYLPQARARGWLNMRGK